MALTLVKTDRVKIKFKVQGDGSSTSLVVNLGSLYQFVSKVPFGSSVSLFSVQHGGNEEDGAVSPSAGHVDWDNASLSGSNLTLPFTAAFSNTCTIVAVLHVDYPS